MSAQKVDAVARLVLPFGVLLFPILLPYILFSLFAKDDDEGIPNEELWRRESRERSIVTGDELQVSCWWYYSWSTRYTNSEGLPSSIINEALCLEVEEQLSNRLNGSRPPCSSFKYLSCTASHFLETHSNFARGLRKGMK